LYWVEDLTLKELSQVFNCGVSSVKNYLNKYGIKSKGCGAKKVYKDFDYDTLYNMYIIQDLSKSEVAKAWNCSLGFVTRELQRLGIKKRTVSNGKVVDGVKVQEAYKGGCGRIDIGKHYGISYDNVMYHLVKSDMWEENTTDITYELLFNLYKNKGMNVSEISDFIDVDTVTIFKHLEKYDLL